MDAGIKFVSKAKIDAYMKLDFKGKKYKTKTIVMEKDGDPIDWNKEFWLPSQLPVLSPTIELRLMDDDDIGSDEMVGTLQFKTKDILEGKYGNKLVWKNIYGSPLNQKGSKYKTMMNEHPEYASQWKGRVLLQVIAEQTEKPLAKMVDMEDEVIALAEDAKRSKEYAIIAQVGQAVALPTNKKYDIRVTVGGHEIFFKPLDQKNATNYKRYGRTEQEAVHLPYIDVQDIGSVIIQLMDGDDPVCYYIDNIKNFMDPNPQMKWYSFMPDLCVGDVTQPDQVAQFSFRMSIHNVTADGPINFKDHKVWKAKVPKRSNPVKIRAYIYQCRDLPAADSEGTSDPFVKVWDVNSKPKKTKVVEDNNNPLFYECIELDYEVDNVDDLESYPPFIFDIYDHDDGLLDSTPDFLCRAVVEPEDCSIVVQKDFDVCSTHSVSNCPNPDCVDFYKRKEIPLEPRWHPCYYTVGTPKCGEILVSFAVTELDYNYPCRPEQLNLGNYVEVREYTVNMLILGLRNLASPGILPVKKAFINFNVKSLVPPNGPSVKNIKTQPQNPGPNPTLNTTMKFTIPLPVDDLYCPRLACSVYDNIFRGFNQPLIGVFTLPIGQLMMDLAEERKTEIQVIKDIVNEINKIQGDPAREPAPNDSVSLNYDESESEIVQTESHRQSLIQKEDLIEKSKATKKKKKAQKIMKNSSSID